MRGARILAALVAISWPAAAASNGLDYRKVVLTGDPAPGTEAGVVLSAFTGGYTHPEPGPRIDAAGRVSFFAFLAGPGSSAMTGAVVAADGGLSL